MAPTRSESKVGVQRPDGVLDLRAPRALSAGRRDAPGWQPYFDQRGQISP